jgi:hypothetical protein
MAAMVAGAGERRNWLENGSSSKQKQVATYIDV